VPTPGRRQLLGALLGALLSAASCGRSAAASEPTPAPAITPVARIQSAIADAAGAHNEEELTFALRELAKLGGPGNRDLVPQLVVFGLAQRDARAALVPGVIRLRLGITDAQLVEALLPYLQTTDREQRTLLYNWLGGIDSAAAAQRDFTLYRTVIAARPNDPPLGLVRYMYETDPDTAVATLAEVYAAPPERATLAATLRPVSEALAANRSGRLDADQGSAAQVALKTLARHSDWWVRLYAATAIVKVPQLQSPELLEVLRADQHPLVRGTIGN